MTNIILIILIFEQMVGQIYPSELWESVIVLCFVAHSSCAIILMEKRKLVASLSLSSLCLVMVVWLFPVVPWVCLRFVIVVFPDHTHLLFC